MRCSRASHRFCRIAATVCLLLCESAFAGVCRVTTAGLPSNNGSSWAQPISLKQALFDSGACTELWVAKGVYKPGAAGSVQDTFAIAGGVGVYGGFSGNETARDQRDPKLNTTILSGDIDNNDVAVAGVVADAVNIVGSNSRHVVYTSGGANTVIDGFTITAGAAAPDYQGGGFLCECSATLSRLVFSGNAALPDGGGGAFYTNASPSLTDIEFRGNRAGARGGAVMVEGYNADPQVVLTHVRFEDNSVSYGEGGALSNYDSGDSITTVTIDHALFARNSAGNNGGALANESAFSKARMSLHEAAFIDNVAGTGGAIFNYSTDGTAELDASNSTFSGNLASSGGSAVSNYALADTASVVLNNVTLSANRITDNNGLEGAVLNRGSPGATALLTAHNAIVWGNLTALSAPTAIVNDNGAFAGIDHSIVQGSGGSTGWNSGFGTDGGFNLDVDPRLEPLTDKVARTFVFSPAGGSPAIDSGDDASCRADDQRGVLRPQGVHCDIGATEVFPIDLITHKSQEACWSNALTRSGFTDLLRSQVEGAVTCVPPTITDNYEVCNTAACPGGVSGCPLTTHAGTFAGAFDDGGFVATGALNDAVIPVVLKSPFTLSCQYDATNVTLSYAPSYILMDDGNFGDYVALLARFAITPSGYTISSANGTCQGFAGTLAPLIVNSAQTALLGNLGQKLRDATQRKAVCPAAP